MKPTNDVGLWSGKRADTSLLRDVIADIAVLAAERPLAVMQTHRQGRNPARAPPVLMPAHDAANPDIHPNWPI